MPPGTSRPNEIGARGEAIYHEKIRALVEPKQTGKFVIIDVDSGDYEVDRQALAASARLRQRRPNAVSYGIRIGYKAAYTLGSEQEPSGD